MQAVPEEALPEKGAGSSGASSSSMPEEALPEEAPPLPAPKAKACKETRVASMEQSEIEREVGTMRKHHFLISALETELMDADLSHVIASPEPLTDDHCRYFAYQLL